MALHLVAYHVSVGMHHHIPQCSKNHTIFSYSRTPRNHQKIPRRDNDFIMGDFNANVRNDTESSAIGKFRLGIAIVNERGERLDDFCKENAFIITNTIF